MPSITTGYGRLIDEDFAIEYLAYKPGRHLLPPFLGGFFDMFLFAISLQQSYKYLKYTNERLFVKCCVYGAFIGSTVATCYILPWNAEMYIWSFGRYLPSIRSTWVMPYIIIDSFTTFVVQVFYVDRAFKLNKRSYIALALGAIPAFIGVVSGFGSAIVTMISVDYVELTAMLSFPAIPIFTFTWLGSVLVADLLITAMIVYGLFRHRTGWSNTDSMVKKLIILIFESQVPALCTAVITTGLWMNHLEIAVAFAMLHPKVYLIGLLVTLNCRMDNNHNPSASYQASHNANPLYGMSERNPNRSIQVEVKTEIVSSKVEEPAFIRTGLNRRRLDPIDDDLSFKSDGTEGPFQDGDHSRTTLNLLEMINSAPQ